MSEQKKTTGRQADAVREKRMEQAGGAKRQARQAQPASGKRPAVPTEPVVEKRRARREELFDPDRDMKRATGKGRVIVKCTPHWIIMFPSLVLAAVCFGAAIFSYSQESMPGVIAACIAGVIFLIRAVLKKISKSLILTENVIIGRSGIIRTTKLMSPIDKIQDISVHSGIIGKMLGYSTITVSTAGTAESEFIYRYITGGNRFQREFINRA